MLNTNRFVYEPGEISIGSGVVLDVVRLEPGVLQVRNAAVPGRSAGEVMTFTRVRAAHPCDNPGGLRGQFHVFRALIAFYLFYLVFSLPVAFINLRNWRFSRTVIWRWMLITSVLTVLIYASAYGFALDRMHFMRPVVDGELNPSFSLLPWRGTYRGEIPKESAEFWMVCVFFISFYYSFPQAVWQSWRLHAAKRWWERMASALAHGSALATMTLVTLSSAVSPDGPRS